jgi:putative PEP-CTERM system TPR-repeat lipoprotein
MSISRTLFLGIFLVVSACGLAMSNEERLDRAEQAIAEGDFRAAIIDSKDVLRDEPDNVRGRLLLAKASLAAQDGAAAEKEFRRAIELGVPKADLVSGLGRSLLLQREFQALLDEMPIDPSLSDERIARLTELRAEAHLGLGQAENAIELFDSVLALEQDNVNAKLGTVSALILQENYIQARATLDSVLTAHPDVVAVWQASGALNLRIQDFESAEANFAVALDRAREQSDMSGRVEALVGLADALFGQGEFDAARDVIAELAAAAPDSVALLMMQSRLAIVDEDWPAAQQDLQQVLQSQPENRLAQMLLGAVQLRSGNLGQAEMYLSAVVAAQPQNVKARQLLAETRLQLRKEREAEDVLRPILTGGDVDPRSLSLAARASGGQGRYDEAIGHLERSLASDPDNNQLQFQMATTYLDAGRYLDAERTLNSMSLEGSEEESFQRDYLLVLSLLRADRQDAARESAQSVADKYPERAAAQNLLGAIEISLENFSDARAAFERGLEVEPGNIDSRRYIAALEAQDGNFDAAERSYLGIIEDEPDASWVFLALARLAALQEDHRKARSWLEKAREADPGAIRARLILARMMIDDGEFGDAEAVLSEILEKSTSNAEAYNLRGIIQLRRENIDQAIDNFQRASELDESKQEYRQNLALAQRRSGDLDGAMRTLDEGPERYLADLRSGLAMAWLKFEGDDAETALEIAAELQNRFPDSPLPHAIEGEILARQDNLSAAVIAYRRAVDVLPYTSHAIRAFQIGNVLGMENAEAPLLKVLEDRPLDNQTRMLLAGYFTDQDEFSKAISEYERVIANEPTNAVALNNLAYSYLEVGDERAEAIARRAHELLPQHPSVNDTLGWVLVQKGEVTEGEQLLRTAAELSDGDPEISYHLAVALIQSGEKAEAKLLLERILSNDHDFSYREEAERLFASL